MAEASVTVLEYWVGSGGNQITLFAPATVSHQSRLDGQLPVRDVPYFVDGLQIAFVAKRVGEWTRRRYGWAADIPHVVTFMRYLDPDAPLSFGDDVFDQSAAYYDLPLDPNLLAREASSDNLTHTLVADSMTLGALRDAVESFYSHQQ
jgi:hypothetical protein